MFATFFFYTINNWWSTWWSTDKVPRAIFTYFPTRVTILSLLLHHKSKKVTPYSSPYLCHILAEFQNSFFHDYFIANVLLSAHERILKISQYMANDTDKRCCFFESRCINKVRTSHCSQHWRHRFHGADLRATGSIVTSSVSVQQNKPSADSKHFKWQYTLFHKRNLTFCYFTMSLTSTKTSFAKSPKSTQKCIGRSASKITIRVSLTVLCQYQYNKVTTRNQNEQA